MTMAKKDRNQKQQYNVTTDTEESSAYDTILSSCCCGSAQIDSHSFLKEKNETNAKQPKQQKENKDIEQSPKFFERLSDVLLLLTGSAPPVKIVRCFECASVDGSELTTPRALANLADEYDKDNKHKVQSMWSLSEDMTDGDLTASNSLEDNPATSVPLAAPASSTISQKPLRLRRGSSGLWLRMKSSGSKCSEAKSQSNRSRSSQLKRQGGRKQGADTTSRSESRGDGKQNKAKGGSRSRPPIARPRSRGKQRRSQRVEI